LESAVLEKEASLRKAREFEKISSKVQTHLRKSRHLSSDSAPRPDLSARFLERLRGDSQLGGTVLEEKIKPKAHDGQNLVDRFWDEQRRKGYELHETGHRTDEEYYQIYTYLLLRLVYALFPIDRSDAKVVSTVMFMREIIGEFMKKVNQDPVGMKHLKDALVLAQKYCDDAVSRHL
jgi:hypothetical protein